MKRNTFRQVLLGLLLCAAFLTALCGLTWLAHHLPFWTVIPLGVVVAALLIVDPTATKAHH